MIETLRTWRGLWGKLFQSSLKLCIFGRWHMCLLWRLDLVTFLFVLLFLVRWFFFYTSYVLRDALCFQWDWFITYKIKNKALLNAWGGKKIKNKLSQFWQWCKHDLYFKQHLHDVCEWFSIRELKTLNFWGG